MHEPDGEQLKTRHGGCLRALIAAPALAVLAPIAAFYRSWARWRRGPAVVVEVQTGAFECLEAGWNRVEATVDIPHTMDGGRLITACVVRVAEGLAGSGDVFHLLHREPGCQETIAVPLGTAINDLAERLILSCHRSVLDKRTMVWPALKRGRHLGEVIDPVTYDPEAPGEPERMLGSAPMTWALVLERHSGTAATRFKLGFIVPEDQVERVEKAVVRLAR